MNTDTLKMILPIVGLFAFTIILYGGKLLIDRSRNIKRATDHVWVEIWPPVGKVYSYLSPILAGGIVRIQDRHGKELARYIMSSGAAKKADWPPGKTNFVQVTLDKIIYREGDSIPMSAQISDRPLFDARQFDSVVENTSTAAAEATKISLEDSKGSSGKKSNPLTWVLILQFAIMLGLVYIIFTQHGLNSEAIIFFNKAGQALGIK